MNVTLNRLGGLVAATAIGLATATAAGMPGAKKPVNLYVETFTRRDLRILTESTSNFDFHYMGSGKIMAQIGKGFAEAMVALMR